MGRIQTANLYNERNASSINSIIIHCIGVALTDLVSCFEKNKVSAHFIIPQNDAPIIQLVPVEKRAWHAGVSAFADLPARADCTDFNSCSIGIEFHSPGYDDSSSPNKFGSYSSHQINAGIKLIKHLVQSYDINPKHIFAHSTISPERKSDPGPNFPWHKLYEEGLGYIPVARKNNLIHINDKEFIPYIQNKLRAIGFINCPVTGELDTLTINHINAFVMQYAQNLWDYDNSCALINQELISYLDGFCLI